MGKKYDFDTVHVRDTSAAEKWKGAQLKGCPKDIMPFTVADMEFAAAPEIAQELCRVAKDGFWGYTFGDDTLTSATVEWMKKRNGWEPKAEWAVYTAGIVPAFYAAVNTFTSPDEGVIIQPPCYPPFKNAAVKTGRKLVENPLLIKDGVYEMDLEGLRKAAKEAKMLILCSPHNPVGRLWSKEELLSVAEICHENDVIVFSDEIHCDLVMPGQTFTSWGALPEKYLQNSIIGTAASKTFSLAGLSSSCVFMANPAMRKALAAQMATYGVIFNSTFGIAGTKAAYTKGEEWLDELLPYLWDNYSYIKQVIEKEIPGALVRPMQATYLAWIDLSALNMQQEELMKFLYEEACFYVQSGTDFGTEGTGHVRMNIACPRKNIEDAMARLVQALKKHRLG